MNKRQRKKLDKKVIEAIYLLNKDLEDDEAINCHLDFTPITYERSEEVYNENIKGNKKYVNNVLNDYNKLIKSK